MTLTYVTYYVMIYISKQIFFSGKGADCPGLQKTRFLNYSFLLVF